MNAGTLLSSGADKDLFSGHEPSAAMSSLLDLESRILPRVWADHVNRLMERQCLDSGVSDGGFDSDGTGWCDGRHAAYSLSTLISSVGRPWDLPSEDELHESIVRTCRFLLRRQHADGRLDLAGAYSPNEVGFTLPGLAAGYRHLAEKNGKGRWEEILSLLQRFLKRGAEAVLAGSAFTANHRWAAACAPLAAVHQLWPDPRYLVKIESYLADGIDCDADGCWYEERSPNYNTVANHGMYVMADCLQRPEFARIVEKNGLFMLHMVQPNGEADSSFSHRQDRGSPNRPVLDYPILRRLAQTTGNGAYMPLLLHHLQHRSKGIPGSGLMPLLYWITENPLPLPEPEPVPDHYDKIFLNKQALRVRRPGRALTLTADSGGHFFSNVRDRWGGEKRSDEWFHLHAQGVVLASIQLAASGLAMFQPEEMEPTPAGALLRSHRDGWVHTLSFRPGSPPLPMAWDWGTSVEVDWTEDLDQIHLNLRSHTQNGLVALLKLWVRPGVSLQEGNADVKALRPRQKLWLKGDKSLLLTPSDNRESGGLRITGLPVSAHHHDHGSTSSIPSAVSSSCACLMLGLCFPVDFRLKIQCQ